MKRLFLALAVLASNASWAQPSREQWFTLAGNVAGDDSDYIQIDPRSIRARDGFRDIDLRVSRKSERVSMDGVKFRSFTGSAEVDCPRKAARFTTATFFAKPHFAGDPVKVLEFGPDVVRPVAFRGIEGDYAGRLIASACAVGAARNR